MNEALEAAKSYFNAALRSNETPNDGRFNYILSQCPEPIPDDICDQHGIKRGTTYRNLIALMLAVSAGLDQEEQSDARAN